MNSMIINSIILLTISTISAMVFCQIFKTLINSIVAGKFDVGTLFSDGDYPSSHTAVIISFDITYWYCVYAYHIYKPDYDLFAVVLLGAFFILYTGYIIKDAMGVRYQVQEHAYAITQIAIFNKLIIKIKQKVGHRPHEVIGGAFTGGFIGSIVICIAINSPKSHVILFGLIITLIAYITIAAIIFSKKRKGNLKLEEAEYDTELQKNI